MVKFRAGLMDAGTMFVVAWQIGKGAKMRRGVLLSIRLR
jgi:hypothetical protein